MLSYNFSFFKPGLLLTMKSQIDIKIYKSRNGYGSKSFDKYKDFLIDNFNKMTNREIAKHIGCNSNTITIWRRQLNLPTRDSCWNVDKIKEIPELKLAYIAGLIDGEGHLSISKCNGQLISPRLTITNTSKQLMKWLKLNFLKVYNSCHQMFRQTYFSPR